MKLELTKEEIKTLAGICACHEKRMWQQIEIANKEITSDTRESIVEMLLKEADKANELNRMLRTNINL